MTTLAEIMVLLGWAVQCEEDAFDAGKRWNDEYQTWLRI